MHRNFSFTRGEYSRRRKYKCKPETRNPLELQHIHMFDASACFHNKYVYLCLYLCHCHACTVQLTSLILTIYSTISKHRNIENWSRKSRARVNKLRRGSGEGVCPGNFEKDSFKSKLVDHWLASIFAEHQVKCGATVKELTFNLHTF